MELDNVSVNGGITMAPAAVKQGIQSHGITVTINFRCIGVKYAWEGYIKRTSIRIALKNINTVHTKQVGR